MRKNSPRKWLHAVLDLLPVLIIPIFALAVRSDNNFQPITINTSGYEIRNKFDTNDVETADDLIEGNIYNVDTFSPVTDNYENFVYIYYAEYIEIETTDYVVYNGEYNYGAPLTIHITADYISLYIQTQDIELSTYYFENIDFTFSGYFANYWLSEHDIDAINPSDFNLLEYVYNEGVVYNDTDVGSQLLYTLYNATDKYFNMNQVFNFGQIYDWLSTNIFNGQVPLVVPIVWNIVLYEFVMDLIFLLYALFMFFIDFCTNLIDRFHATASGR